MKKENHKTHYINGLIAALFFFTIYVIATHAHAGGGGIDTSPPEAITTLSVVTSGQNSVTLQWTAVSGNNNGEYPTPLFAQGVWYSRSTIIPYESPAEGSYSSYYNPTIVPAPATPGTVQTATIPNLTSGVMYYFRMSSNDGTNPTVIGNEVSVVVGQPSDDGDGDDEEEPPQNILQPPPASTDGVGASAGTIQPREAVFSGKVFPGGRVELLVKNTIGADYLFLPDTRVSVDATGTFKVSAKPLLAKEYFFALKAKDKDGRETSTIGFPVDFNTTQKFEKTDIFFPPTIGSASSVVSSGAPITILGYAFSNNDVLVEFDGEVVATVHTGSDGAYSHAIESGGLSSGTHTARVRQKLPGGELTSFSQTHTLRISSISNPKADFNNDNAINIIDWSVFLTAWGSGGGADHTRADLDGDGTVSISDFAIFLKAIVVE